MAVSFKEAHFPKDIILTYVRWYVAYLLRTRHGKKLMEERSVSVDHTTINRWVIKYSPQLEEAFPRDIVEQDHRAVKRVTRPMLGCKSFDAAQGTLAGIELMHVLKKRQLVVEAGDEGRPAAEQFCSLAA